MAARVKMAEAARQLGVNRSTITRWVAKNPALADSSGRVDVEELRRHRDEVINPALQTRGAAAGADPEPVAPTERAAPAQRSLNDDRGRSERLKADALELDMAERLGRTLVRDEVEAALADAVAIIRQKAAQLVRDHAEAIARMEDVRETEVALDEIMRELLEKSADALGAAGASDQGADAA